MRSGVCERRELNYEDTNCRLLYQVWICEDLYPDIYKRNYEEHCMDVLVDEVPEELMERVKKSMEDCAVAAIRFKE